MKNNMKKIINSRYFPYLVIILLGIITTMPLFTMNLSEYNEFRIHIGRVTSVKEILEDGIFPPFISYKHMLTFGYALNIFYGSLTTYIPILISFLVGSTTMALKIFTVFTVILSGTTMYMFVYKVTNKKLIGLISALVYMVAPYKFTNIYSRNAVGEYTAFIFIPMIFLGLYDLINNNKKGNYWLISGGALLILSHTITTVYTVFFAVLFLAFNFKKIKQWSFWKHILIDIIWILILTSFYTIPLIEHKIYGDYLIFDANAMNSSSQFVYQNTNNPLDWLHSEFSHSQTPHEDLIFSFGVIITFLMVISIFCYKKTDKKYKDIYGTFGILAIISLFMATKAFPWLVMPQLLTVIQFAWRLNGFFVFFIALVCGVNAVIFANMLSKILDSKIGKKKAIYNLSLGTCSVIIVAIFIIGWFNVSPYIKQFDSRVDKQFENNMLESESIGPYNVNRDYLPLATMNNIQYLQNRENKTIVTNGEAVIRSEKKEKLNDVIEITDVNNATLELPFLFYHGYKVTLNGNEIKTFENDKGFMCVKVNESGTVEINYTGTLIEKAGFIISGIGIIIIFFIKNSLKTI